MQLLAVFFIMNRHGTVVNHLKLNKYNYIAD